MSAGPGRIIEEVRIDLPRPRRMTDPGFNDYRARLPETLERGGMRAHAEDEGLAVASAPWRCGWRWALPICSSASARKRSDTARERKVCRAARLRLKGIYR